MGGGTHYSGPSPDFGRLGRRSTALAGVRPPRRGHRDALGSTDSPGRVARVSRSSARGIMVGAPPPFSPRLLLRHACMILIFSRLSSSDRDGKRNSRDRPSESAEPPFLARATIRSRRCVRGRVRRDAEPRGEGQRSHPGRPRRGLRWGVRIKSGRTESTQQV